MFEYLAVNDKNSLGREFHENFFDSREAFQRDRDRIIHSKSFRRLEHKTQVFINNFGDHYRNRLTHSLEVSQISRDISRSLGLNEDLCESIALAHDLGHAPFGHVGQDALNSCMDQYGGFEHNYQSLRIVTNIERVYKNFRGLNLSYEVKEGILKHCSKRRALKLGKLGERFLKRFRPSLEAQIVNLSDEIAYNNHDLDDGFRANLISLDEILSLDIVRIILRESDISDISDEHILVSEIIRKSISFQIKNLIEESVKRIKKYDPKCVADVRSCPELINFSENQKLLNKQLKLFLRKKIYNHSKLVEDNKKAKKIIKFLFQHYQENFSFLPSYYYDGETVSHEEAISDYISGMTDRYAINLYKELINGV